MKKLIAVLLTVCLSVSLLMPSAFAFTFEELDNEEIFSEEIIEKETVSGWAKSEVDAARAIGLIPNFTGDPGYRDTITREQFAELMVNLVENVCGRSIEPAPASTFSDCTNEAVLKAYAAKIVQGVGGGKYNPNGEMNREQLATMLYRAWEYLAAVADAGISDADRGLDEYSDAAQVSSWANYALDILVHAGILKGSGGKLMPKQSFSVEQSILLTYRLYADHVEAWLK